MALVNHATREVQFKIVYCGTPLGGKTTNLTWIHAKLDPSLRGDLISLATASHRTLFFDYLPVKASPIAGYQTRFQLYTVPGQNIYDETREIVLRGADGLVFVADSHPGRMDANCEALLAVGEAIRRSGANLANKPAVYQYNKRDLPKAVPAADMDARFQRSWQPVFLACATMGTNVFATLEAVVQEVLRRFHSDIAANVPAQAANGSPPSQRPAGAGMN